MRHPTAARSRSTLFVLVLALTGAAACGGDDGSGGGDGSRIADLMRQMPSIERGDQTVFYLYGDLVAASESAGLERPTSLDSDDDLDAFVEWVLTLSGSRSSDEPATVAARFPEAVNLVEMRDQAEFADEVGWSLVDVERYLEVSALPVRFTLIDGTVDTEAVEDAVGEARNDIWSLGDGDDFESGFGNRSVASPLGVPVRMATRDGLFATTTSSDMAGDFVDGDDLGGDEGFNAVAEQLDEAEVYGAFLLSVREDRDGSPFDTVGVGGGLDGDEALVVAVYHYADAEAAADGVADVEDVLDGESRRTGEPWSDSFSATEVVADGATVVATLRLSDDQSPTMWQNVVMFGYSLLDF